MPDPENMTARQCLKRAKKVHRSNRIDESPLYWIDRALEKMDGSDGG